MTRIFIYLTITLLAVSCAPSGDSGEIPSDPAQLRTMQSSLKDQIHGLQKKLESVESKLEEVSPSTEKTAVLVTTETIQTTTFNHYVDIQARVESDDVVRLGAETGGRIVKLNVNEGDFVKKGALIASIDMEQVNKQLAELETSYSLAVDVFNRQKRLWDQKIGTELQYLQSKNDKERLEKSMELLKHQMSKSGVYSPIHGVIETVMLKEGELASPGMPIVEIVNTNDLKVVADLPENYLKSVSRGDVVDLHFPALGDSLTGKIALVGKTIDPSNRTFKVEVSVPNVKGLLKPNLLANMKINDYTEKEVIVIPSNLLQQEIGGRNYVIVAVDHDGQKVAKRVYIKTGKSGDNAIVVTSGLKAGDVLVKEGARGLAEGDPITITNPSLSDNG